MLLPLELPETDPPGTDGKRAVMARSTTSLMVADSSDTRTVAGGSLSGSSSLVVAVDVGESSFVDILKDSDSD